MSLYIGIDLGTSGCRAIGIDHNGRILASQSSPYPSALSLSEQDPLQLWQHVFTCLHSVIQQLDSRYIKTICVDATSGSVMLASPDGMPLTPLLLYSDTRARRQAELIQKLAPATSAVHGPASGLAKLLWLQAHSGQADVACLLHQADWINFRLGAELGVSDYNNALKTGYDSKSQRWPDWLSAFDLQPALPSVVEPGTHIGQMPADLAETLGLDNQPVICAGTTDSTASFIATGAARSGEAVSILGSTLVLKLLADKPVFDLKHGIYSHRLGDLWLTGGASNTGGRVLGHFFSDAELETLSKQIDLTRIPPDYYPLLEPGERFPVADPDLQPRLSPRPRDNALFLYGLLDAMSRLEQRGYQLLTTLSGNELASIRTSGGGSRNRIWHTIRQQYFSVPVTTAEHADAAYGAALVARDGLAQYKR